MPYLFIRTKHLQWIALFLFSLCLFLLLLPLNSEQSSSALPAATAPAAIYKGENHIALTVNVTDSEKNIEKLVKVLVKNQTTASFFITSAWIDKHPKTAKLLAEREFDIGVLLTESFDKKKSRKEIRAVQKALSPYSKKEIVFIRSANGLENSYKAAELKDYLTVQWSVDLRKSAPSDFVRHAHKGDIVLLNPKEDLRITAKWISLLSKKEKLVSLSEMAGGQTEVEYIP